MKNKLIIALMSIASVASAQYTSSVSGSSILAGELNSKPGSLAAPGAPSGACTPGLSFYLDTTAHLLYHCSQTNTWVTFFRLDGANTISTGIQDFSAATHFRVPNASGYTPTATGHFGYDIGSNTFKGYAGSVQTFAFLNSDITGTAANVSGVVAAANGGSGQSSYTIGDILFASGGTTLSKLAGVATGNVLISGGVGTAPSWGKVGLGTHVSGILPAANGGTGVANTVTLTLGSAAQNWATLGTGLVKNTTTTGALSTAVSSDVIGLWTGTCNSSTWLRADGSCTSPAGSGTVTVVATGSLTSTALVTGGGAQALQTPSATATMDGSGNISTPGSVTTGAGGTVAGHVGLGSGTASAAPSGFVGFQAPTTVTTPYYATLPGAPSTGYVLNTGTTDPTTVTYVPTITVATGGTGLTGGTSGGVLAFTAAGTIASSGTLTAGLPVIGGGAGAAPTIGTRSGNTTAYVTTTGTQTSGDCVKIDASGNHIANGSPCGGLTNPMTTAGDLIAGGSGGTPTRLAPTAGYAHWTGSAWTFDTPSGAGNVAVAGTNTYTSVSTNDFSAARIRFPEATFASAPVSPVTGQEYVFTDASAAGTCTGGGTALSLCRWNGSGYDALGGGSGSGYYQTAVGPSTVAQSNATVQTQRPKKQFRNGFTLTDNGSDTTIVDVGWMPNSRVVNIREEFWGAGSTPALGTHGWMRLDGSGTGASAHVTLGDSFANPGIVRVTSGALSGNFSLLSLSGNTGPAGQLGTLGANANWGFVWVFKMDAVAAATATTRFKIGVSDWASSNIDPQAFIGLRFDTSTSDTNFQFYVKPTSGGGVAVDSGLAADATAFHTLVVYSTTIGTIRMSLDGGAEKTLCASGCDGTVTVPVSAMDPITIIGNDATAAARTVDLDLFEYGALLNTNTTNKRN